MNVPKLKFVQVTLQVLFAAKAICALHWTLEVAKEILDGIRGLTFFADIDAVVLVPAVFDPSVFRELFADFRIEGAFVRVQFWLAVYVSQ